MNKIGYTLIGVGITIMIGTAGASDVGTYALCQTVAGVLAGTVIGLIGAALVKMEEWRRWEEWMNFDGFCSRRQQTWQTRCGELGEDQ